MKKFLVFVYIFFATTANVFAAESTSPLCTIEEFEQQKALNSELYESCQTNDGAFLCLHDQNSDELSIECRVLYRSGEPNVACSSGKFPVQNYEEGIVSPWFCDNFTFSEDPLNLCTKEDRERKKTESPEQYKFCLGKNEAIFITRYDSEDRSIIMSDCRVLLQDPTYPANIICNDGKYPVQNFVHKTGRITPWFCDTGSSTIPIKIIQKN